MISEIYRKSFKEVYVILNCLPREEFDKIPKKFIDKIYKNMDANYKYKMNEDMNLNNQEMLTETKAILFNIFRDYLSEPNQRSKIIEWQAEARNKNQKLKQINYKAIIFNNKENISKYNEIKNKKDIIKYKETLFKIFSNFIRRIFSTSKVN